MKIMSTRSSIGVARSAIFTQRLLLALALAGTTASLHGQSIDASGQISGVAAGGGLYDYTLTVSEASDTTTPIASFWYSWVPGGFFLPSDPSSAAGPTGWSAGIVANSIQYSSGSTATDIAPGTSKTFSYVASFSPAQLAATPNSGITYAYAGAVDASTPFEAFTVTEVVPEPSATSLLAIPLVGWLIGRFRGRQSRLQV
jgi:hypothetical protein